MKLRARKVHHHSYTDGENYVRKFDDLAKNFIPQSEKEHEFLQSTIGQYLCGICEISQQSPRLPAQRCDLEPFHERLLTGVILAEAGP